MAEAAWCAGEPLRLGCDSLLMSGGWSPDRPPPLPVARQAALRRGAGRLRARRVGCQPERSAGACNGAARLADCLAEGCAGRCARPRSAAGFSAAEPTCRRCAEPAAGPLLRLAGAEPSAGRAGQGLRRLPERRHRQGSEAWPSPRASSSIEHVKRYTTTGMGTDQGKTSNVNALAIVADKRGMPIEAIGTTTFRQPYTPVTFGALAGPHGGELFDPIRRTPSHDWATARGAVFEDVGNWKRARYFPQAGEDMHAAVPARMPRRARAASACSTPARWARSTCRARTRAEFLNRVYTNAWTKLAVGRCRYGLMLRDDGMVFDDGVTARLGAGHFHMTTTTGGAARVLAWLEEWLQTEWPQLEVYCTSVTEQWAAMAVVGPKAREVLRPLGTDIDLADDALPHLAFAAGTVAGMPGARVPDQLLRRDGLRGQRALGLWRGLVGGACGRPVSLRHHALRHRGHARAARREGLHHRRPGHRWHRDARTISAWIGSSAKPKPDFLGKRGLRQSGVRATGASSSSAC